MRSTPNEIETVSYIIWDWNGTLFDDASACVETLNIILKKRSLPQVDIEIYRDNFDFPVKNFYVYLGFDFAKEDWDAMAHEFHEIYLEKARDKSLRNGAKHVLENLKEAEIPMGVLSASETSMLETALQSKGIRSFFDITQGLSDIYAHSKLDAGRELISSLPVPSEQVLLIGDTIHDYEIAKDLGCQCILLSGGHQAEHRIAKCGCPVLKDILDIPNLIL